MNCGLAGYPPSTTHKLSAQTERGPKPPSQGNGHQATDSAGSLQSSWKQGHVKQGCAGGRTGPSDIVPGCPLACPFPSLLNRGRGRQTGFPTTPAGVPCNFQPIPTIQSWATAALAFACGLSRRGKAVVSTGVSSGSEIPLWAAPYAEGVCVQVCVQVCNTCELCKL